MARSCGIHIDRDHVRIVSLDGSAKKHKLALFDSAPIQGSVADTIKALAKRNKLKAEDIGLAVGSSSAAFRRMSLPFDDRNKIEEVIKFEVESELPQWDIDDIIVDFLVTDSRPGVSSELVVCAVPKEHLGEHIECLSKAGLEPTEAELDASAAFDGVAASGELSEESGTIIVNVGDASTVIAVCDGTKLESLRALRLGAGPVNRVVVDEATDETPDGAEDGEPQDEAQDEAPADDAETETTVPSVADAQRAARSVQRLRRELMRTITAAQTEFPIDTVLLCGSRIEGLDSMELEGVDVRWATALEGDVPSEAMVAYGAAIHQLGGGAFHPSMRREELRYTGTLERLELPLAVCAMLLFAFLAVKFIIVKKHLGWRDEGNLANNEAGDAQLWLQATLVYLLPKEGRSRGRLETPSEELTAYAQKALAGEDLERTKYEELLHIRKLLTDEILSVRKEIGQVTDITLPLSAFKGGVLVMDAIDKMKADGTVPRFACRALEGRSVSRDESKGGDVVEVKVTLDFWGETATEATRHYNEFKANIESQPWYEEIKPKPLKMVEGEPVASVEGLEILVDPSKAADAAQ